MQKFNKIFVSGAVRSPIAHLSNVKFPCNVSYMLLIFTTLFGMLTTGTTKKTDFCQKSHYLGIQKIWMKTAFSGFLTLSNDPAHTADWKNKCF